MSTTRKRPADPATTTTSPLVRDILNEQWICKRLALGDLFAGVTSIETRRDRLKVVLLERGLTEAIAGAASGKPVKWRDLFKQLYCEDL